MKFIGKALILGLAVSAASVAACSSEPNQGPTTQTGSNGPTAPENTGSVGLQYTLPGGEVLNAVNYTLTNGTTTLTGTINVAGASTISFVVGNVPSGSGYTLALSGVTVDGTTTCTGTSAPFSVSNRVTTTVNVPLVCTLNAASDAGSVLVNGTTSNCPIWNTIVANPSSLSTSAPGNISLLTASATGPNPAALTYTWTVTSGTGKLSGQVQPDADDSTVTFTCPTTGETDIIQLVVSDQTGATCPAADTTGTVSITCGTPACTAGAAPADNHAEPATPFTAAGSCAAFGPGSINFGDGCCYEPCAAVGNEPATPFSATGSCAAFAAGSTNNGAGCCLPPAVLHACITTTDTDCVSCQGNAHNGVCTPTEAALVQRDIVNKIATVAGNDPAAGCYSCASSKFCLDDNAGDSGQECEDPITTGTTAPCEAVLSCILGSGTGTAASSCAATAVNACYCGPAFPGSACTAAGSGVNGACDTQIAAGLGLAISDNVDILKDLEDTTRAAGIATSIIQCAATNKCAACLE